MLKIYRLASAVVVSTSLFLTPAIVSAGGEAHQSQTPPRAMRVITDTEYKVEYLVDRGDGTREWRDACVFTNDYDYALGIYNHYIALGYTPGVDLHWSTR